jgi:hypothetical protein
LEKTIPSKEEWIQKPHTVGKMGIAIRDALSEGLSFKQL